MKQMFQLWQKSSSDHRYRALDWFATAADAAAAAGIPDLGDWGASPGKFYIHALPASWLIEPVRAPETDADRIELAIELALKYGPYDGGHHKDWTIDQMIRVLAGDKYCETVGEDWEEGVAP